MRIAVDLMGADLKPKDLLAGLHSAARECPDLHIIAVGRESDIRPYIDKELKNIEIRNANDVIGPDEDPAFSVRRKKEASMVVAGQMVFDGEADAMISAGNTGALVATGIFVMKRMDGVERPGLAPMIPTVDNVGVIALDLGANMDAQPEHLVQYAIMGSIYREKINGIVKPRVGLLNVGTEEGKGNKLTSSAYDLLAKAPIHFVGNVEARDVLTRNCDVLICDGFVGNVLLKAMEGTANTMFSIIRNELTSSFFTKLLALPLRSSLRKIKDKYNYKSTGGGILLGVNGLCFKAHGSSDSFAFKNAIFQARKAIENDLIGVIAKELQKQAESTDRK